MYVVELSLRLSPVPLTVQRKDLEAAQGLYAELRQGLEHGSSKLIELTCEKDTNKRITVLASEVLAVQLYEKTTVGSGGRRPGFSFDS